MAAMSPEMRSAAARKAAATRRARLGLPPAEPKSPAAPKAPHGPAWEAVGGGWVLAVGSRRYAVSPEPFEPGAWRARWAAAGSPAWLPIAESCPSAEAAREAVAERLAVLGLRAPAALAA